MNMEIQKKDNSDAFAKMKTVTVTHQKIVKAAAANGNATEFQIVLKTIKFPMNLIVNMDEFKVACKYLVIENGMYGEKANKNTHTNRQNRNNVFLFIYSSFFLFFQLFFVFFFRLSFLQLIG